jgi:hypothetical protein
MEVTPQDKLFGASSPRRQQNDTLSPRSAAMAIKLVKKYLVLFPSLGNCGFASGVELSH